MENKFELSDILKYIMIGCFFLISFFSVIDSDIRSLVSALELGSFYEALIKILIIPALLLSAYLIGFLIQTLKYMISYSAYYRFYDFLETFKYRKNTGSAKSQIRTCLWKTNEYSLAYRVLKKSVGLVIYYLFRIDTIQEQCLKRHRRPSLRKPVWIALSDKPVEAMERLIELADQKTKQQRKSEYLVLYEMLQGIGLSCLLITVIYFVIAITTAPPGLFSMNWYVLIFPGLYVAGCWLSAALASRYFHFLEKCRETYDIPLNQIIGIDEAQKVYVCVRTRGDTKELRNALHSLAEQKDIAPIVLLQCDREDRKSEVLELVQSFRKRINICVDFYAAGGPAGSIFRLIDVVIHTAKPSDIVFILDDDDNFFDAHSLYRVVVRMNRLNANICLLPFREESLVEKSIVIGKGRYHNSLCSQIAKRAAAVKAKDVQNIQHCASMAWTKAVRAEILQKYFFVLNPCNIHEKLTRYEDFPSFLCLLFRDSKITSVSEQVYVYHKRVGSITDTLDAESFTVQRIGFLWHIVRILKTDKFDEESEKKRRTELTSYSKFCSSTDEKIENLYSEFCGHTRKILFCNEYRNIAERYLRFKIDEIAGIVSRKNNLKITAECFREIAQTMILDALRPNGG